MKTVMEFYEFIADHKIAAVIVCNLWLFMTVFLNLVYAGKPVPVTGMILRPWMVMVNCCLVAAIDGNVTTVALLG